MHGVTAASLLEAALTLLELLSMAVAAVHPVLKLQTEAMAVASGATVTGAYAALRWNAALVRECALPGIVDIEWLHGLGCSLSVHFHKAFKQFGKLGASTSAVEARSLAEALNKLCTCLGGGGGSCSGLSGGGSGGGGTEDPSAWFDLLRRLQRGLGRWVNSVRGEDVLSQLVMQKATSVDQRTDTGTLRSHPLCRRSVTTCAGADAAASVDSVKMAAECNNCSSMLSVPLAMEDGAPRFATISDERSWAQLDGSLEGDGVGGSSGSGATGDEYGCMVTRAELEATNCASVWLKLRPETVDGDVNGPEHALCLCRPWPSARLLQREVRRVDKKDKEANPDASWEAIANDVYGLSAAALEELCLLQGLHLTAPRSAHDNIVVPLGIVREDIYHGETEEDADAFTPIGGEGRALAYYIVTPRGHVPLALFLSRAAHYLRSHDDRLQQLSRRSTGADMNASVGAMKRQIAGVLTQLCSDLFAVLRHCCMNGVLFRYTGLEEQVFVTEQGRLVFGSFGGAGTGSPGINSVLYTTAAPPLQQPGSGASSVKPDRHRDRGNNRDRDESAKRMRVDHIAHLQRLQTQPGSLPAPLDPTDRSKDILTAANDFMFKQALHPSTPLECVLGASPTIFSTIYALGSTCGHLLSAGTVNPTVATVSAMKMESQQCLPSRAKASSSSVRDFNNRQVLHLTRYLHCSPVVGDSGMHSVAAGARAAVAALQDCPYAGLFPLSDMIEHRPQGPTSTAAQCGFGADMLRVAWPPLLPEAGGGAVAGALATMCDILPEKRCRGRHVWEVFEALVADCALFSPSTAPAVAAPTAYAESVTRMWRELQSSEATR